ncbi:MAG TPA: HAMP domain-containing sensor histidine kinase [Pseudonocardiaceae bacterium]|jgi:signal transduction histidine kinase|nr:HAMP domain-containing sensor histidine kinase [Pseudonocardiaceae bacterium]
MTLHRLLRRIGRRAGTDRCGTESALLKHMTWRWGLQISICVAVIVLALSGLAVLIVLRSQQSAASALLTQAAQRADDVVDPPAGVWLVIADGRGTQTTVGLPAALPDRAVLDRVARTGQAETDMVQGAEAAYQLYTVRRGPDTVQAVLDLRANHDERERLLAAMLASGALGLVLAAVAGAWFGRRATTPVAAALALQRRFVSDASHELRTPLTHLSIRVQLLRRHLRRGAPQDQLTAEMDGVVGDAEHLSVILEDLLLAADTRAETRTDPIDLVVLAAQVVAAGTPAAAQRNISISCRPENPSAVVGGSRGGLRRALTAILDNALQHAATSVTVTIRRTEGKVVVDIDDDGPGIEPAMLPHLFERFASARRDAGESGRTDRLRHYGIGLALVSEIATRHGGTITAHNRPGGGASLRLSLPELAEVTT